MSVRKGRILKNTASGLGLVPNDEINGGNGAVANTSSIDENAKMGRPRRAAKQLKSDIYVEAKEVTKKNPPRQKKKPAKTGDGVSVALNVEENGDSVEKIVSTVETAPSGAGRGRKVKATATVVEVLAAPKGLTRKTKNSEADLDENDVGKTSAAKRGRKVAAPKSAKVISEEKDINDLPKNLTKDELEQHEISPKEVSEPKGDAKRRKKVASKDIKIEADAVTEYVPKPIGGNRRKKVAEEDLDNQATVESVGKSKGRDVSVSKEKITAPTDDKEIIEKKKTVKASAKTRKQAPTKENKGEGIVNQENTTPNDDAVVEAAAINVSLKGRKRAAIKESINGSNIANADNIPSKQEPKAESIKQKGKKGLKRVAAAKSKDNNDLAINDNGDDANVNEVSKKPKLNPTITSYNDAEFAIEDDYKLKISSWNVAGIRAWLTKGGLEYIDREKPDILCLQETKCVVDQLPESARIPGYHPYWVCKPGGHAGVAIYSKVMPINVEYGIDDPEQDAKGRIITAEYEKFYLICVYVPNAGRKLVTLPSRMRWDTIFQNYVTKLDKMKPVIICGDMNVAHEEIDLANPKSNKKNAGFTQEERDGMTKLLSMGFVDTFRQLYPDKEKCYSFWSYMGNARSKNVGWRLDYFILSERISGKVVENTMRTNVLGSDHCPITLFLNVC